MVKLLLRIFALAILASAHSGAASSNEFAAPPVAVDTSAALAHSPPTPTPPSKKVLQACSRVDRDDHIRMRGDFGKFQGYASVVGPEGIDGLRAEHAQSAAPTGLVTWDQIDRMEKRGGNAGKGVLYGALSFGLIGGMLGGAAGHISEGGEVAGPAAAGAAVGVLVGAGLGALVGAQITSSHGVYHHPRGSR